MDFNFIQTYFKYFKTIIHAMWYQCSSGEFFRETHWTKYVTPIPGHLLLVPEPWVPST